MLYTAYMGGDIGETVIDTGRDELPNILIYGDSFTNPLECLMYYSFNEMHSIDLRYYKDMTLEDYIRLYQPTSCCASGTTASCCPPTSTAILSTFNKKHVQKKFPGHRPGNFYSSMQQNLQGSSTVTVYFSNRVTGW